MPNLRLSPNRSVPRSNSPATLAPPERFHDESASSSEAFSSPVHLSQPSSRQISRNPSPFAPLPPSGSWGSSLPHTDIEAHREAEEELEFEDWDDQDFASPAGMPSDLRPTLPSSQPLLSSDKLRTDYDSPHRPPMPTRRSTFRERDPELEAKQATRRRYTYAGCFLILSLISFTVQTETAVYIQHNLKWNKAYCML